MTRELAIKLELVKLSSYFSTKGDFCEQRRRFFPQVGGQKNIKKEPSPIRTKLRRREEEERTLKVMIAMSWLKINNRAYFIYDKQVYV
jgi:hypothetical protein